MAITFTYSNKTLFNDVSLLSAYMTKNLSENLGANLDEFAISEDEHDVYGVCLKQTLPNIHECLIKLNYGETGVVVDGDSITITIKDNKAYNDNVKTLVEDTLYDCLKYGVLSEFYSININPTLQKLSQDKFASYLLLLNQRLFQLKRKRISSVLD